MSLSNKEIAAAMKSLRSTHIVTDRDQAFEKHLRLKFELDDEGEVTHEPVRATGGTETGGIAFIEGSGGGKTTAILEVLRNFAPLALNPATEAPRYLHVKVESPATLRSLGVDVLKKLGVDKVADRARVYDVWDMVRYRLKVAGVTLLWIDEAHDMFKSGSGAETENMFKMLKGLMQGDYPVVLVLSGTERLSAITSIDPQVNRRFSKIRPAPMAFGVDNARIKGLIQGYSRKAGLQVAIDDDTINRLIHGSRYRFGRCVVCIIEAIECALYDGAPTLEAKHFEDAWGTREGCSIDQNVFTSTNWMAIELEDQGEEIAEMPAVKKKINRKKAA
ncbi:MAG: TniB family NTP-binding protein [Alphaproteobacteria bacterium]|nr:TniB family NTP-binding protein [Alphaproteobacteria bacterium]MBU1828100.1 TniB family NTP-binding protein [Alphaproteobacteria bacterium]MBU2078123.1 TniB family NTP-binding protein [Alphaproteobacteria bacterium]